MNNQIRSVYIKPHMYGESYTITDNGQVFGRNINKQMKTKIDCLGIQGVVLKRNTNKLDFYYIEDLVSEYYLPINTNENAIIVHIDGNLLNCHYTNLKYSDFKEPESINYGHRKFIIFQFDLLGNFIKKWNSIDEIIKMHPEYKHRTIKANLYKESESSCGFIWSYSRKLKDIELKDIKILENKYFLEKDNHNYPDDKEYWKDIIGYETRYKISNHGNVYSKQLQILFKKQRQNDGDHYVQLHDEKRHRKIFLVKRLVAIHFIPNPQNLPCVIHKDKNNFNDHYSNLKWCTYSDIGLYYRNNIKKPEINQYDFDNNLIKEWKHIDEILESNPTYKKEHIKKCLNGYIDTAYNYVWKYKDIPHAILNEITIEHDEEFKNIGIYKKYDFSSYEVSNHGKIRHSKNQYYLALGISKTGYYRVALYTVNYTQRINIQIHRLVAYKFCNGRSEIDKYVNHIDENTLNNNYKNLEWCTNKKNITHSLGKKVNQIDIQTGKIIKTFDSIAEAASIFSDSKSYNISKVCNDTQKTAYGYKWEYCDDYEIIIHTNENNMAKQKDLRLNQYNEYLNLTTDFHNYNVKIL